MQPRFRFGIHKPVKAWFKLTSCPLVPGGPELPGEPWKKLINE